MPSTRSRAKERVFCVECGKNIIVQKHSVHTPLCYGGCRGLKTKNCQDCGREFRARPGSKRDSCGESCPSKNVFFKCINCFGTGKRPKRFGAGNFCGELCRIEWECKMYDLEFDRSSFFRSKYSKRRKQAMAQGDDIDRMDLFEYYGWTCHLCDGEIDRELRHPHPMSATIDHVVPLERGGRHVWDNVKPAHKQCNEAKGSDTVL